MKTAFIVCIFAEIAAVLVHLKLPAMRKSKLRRIIGKGICSLIFTLTAFFAAMAQGGGTIDGYGRLIIAGAVFGMIGDVFLALKMKDVLFGVGVFSFFIGHIFYIFAFVGAALRFDADTPFFTAAGAVGGTLLIAFFAWGTFKLKAKLRGAFAVGIAVYTSVIALMLVKAVRLGLAIGFDGSSAIAALCLILGSALFVTSDTFLAIGAFTDARIKGRDYVVLGTYFTAQTMIASTAYLIPALLTPR